MKQKKERNKKLRHDNTPTKKHTANQNKTKQNKIIGYSVIIIPLYKNNSLQIKNETEQIRRKTDNNMHKKVLTGYSYHLSKNALINEEEHTILEKAA